MSRVAKSSDRANNRWIHLWGKCFHKFWNEIIDKLVAFVNNGLDVYQSTTATKYSLEVLLCFVAFQLIARLCDHILTDSADAVSVFRHFHVIPMTLDAVFRCMTSSRGPAIVYHSNHFSSFSILMSNNVIVSLSNNFIVFKLFFKLVTSWKKMLTLKGSYNYRNSLPTSLCFLIYYFTSKNNYIKLLRGVLSFFFHWNVRTFLFLTEDCVNGIYVEKIFSKMFLLYKCHYFLSTLQNINGFIGQLK